MTVFLVSLLPVKIPEANLIRFSMFWVSPNESEEIMAIQRHGSERPS